MKIDGQNVEKIPTEIYSNIMIITPKINSDKTTSF